VLKREAPGFWRHDFLQFYINFQAICGTIILKSRKGGVNLATPLWMSGGVRVPFSPWDFSICRLNPRRSSGDEPTGWWKTGAEFPEQAAARQGRPSGGIGSQLVGERTYTQWRSVHPTGRHDSIKTVHQKRGTRRAARHTVARRRGLRFETELLGTSHLRQQNLCCF